jgi:hypothetical protein
MLTISAVVRFWLFLVPAVLAGCSESGHRTVTKQPSGMTDAEQLEAIMRAGQEIERARNAPFNRDQFSKDVAIARRPFDDCVQGQIDSKLKSLDSALTPGQKANVLLGGCRSKLQPVFDLIYVSPLANNPTEARKVTDEIWSDGMRRIIDAI